MKRAALYGVMLFAILAVTSSRALCSSNLLNNGAFQTGDFTDWTIFTTSNGTNGSGYPYVSSFDVTGGGAQNAGTFDVGEVSYTGLFEGGGVWQDFTTSGGLATLSFDWASWDQPNESQNADGGQFALVLDGVTLASYDIGNINSGQVVRGSFSVNDTLTPGTHQFEILIERPYVSCGFDCTPQQFVTNASVLGNSGGTTPEPGTLLLFGSGLVGLAGVVRRKRG